MGFGVDSMNKMGNCRKIFLGTYEQLLYAAAQDASLVSSLSLVVKVVYNYGHRMENISRSLKGLTTLVNNMLFLTGGRERNKDYCIVVLNPILHT